VAKATGIVRKIDDLGRFTLPMELRRTLNIQDFDSLEVYVEGDRIILRKHEPACVFCGDADQVAQFKGKNICQSCLSMLTRDASHLATAAAYSLATSSGS
jgi:transcriptional pleiotropic regulator of transition state genes